MEDPLQAPMLHAAGSAHEAANSRGCAHQLVPILDAKIAHFIATERERLMALVDRHGSPLNVVWPHTVAQNVDAMVRMLMTHDVEYEIFYGAKVNKSRALVRAAVAAGVGIDVSSLAEFDDALRAGVDPARICATGPAKTTAFHQALLAAGSLIAVDSLEELGDLATCLSGAQRARVLLRLRPRSEALSRFGMSEDAVLRALQRLARDVATFVFEGFHVHLGSYAVETRIAAMAELAMLVEVAEGLGLNVRTIDIGGGMPIRYVAPDAYAAMLGTQRPGNYRNAKMPKAFYPYGSDKTAADWIDAFLSASCRGGSIARYLREKQLRLAIEPGRSLVDQAAISIFRVTRVKPIGDSSAVVFVEGSSFSACETWCASEFLVDPILVPVDHGVHRAPLRAYIAGHSCLDDDVVTNRFLDFPATPQRGDLLIYANTAGYQMDLLENEFHRHPMPVRLTAGQSASGELIFVQDK